jgi:hypothetical protein
MEHGFHGHHGWSVTAEYAPKLLVDLLEALLERGLEPAVITADRSVLEATTVISEDRDDPVAGDAATRVDAHDDGGGRRTHQVLRSASISCSSMSKLA